MSLKAFHVLFITLSILLAVGFGAWALREYAATEAGGYLAAAASSGLSGAALAVYGVKFLEKCRRAGIR